MKESLMKRPTFKPFLKYILKGKKPVVEKNLLKWARWFEVSNRHVGKTKIGKVAVSTVFLGIDHGFSLNFPGKPIPPPILFETMVFGGKLNLAQERYTTWEEAEKGHAKWVAKVRRQNGKK